MVAPATSVPATSVPATSVPGAPGPATPATSEAVYRDVRWRRSQTGRMLWFNEGMRRWALWVPGSDAPPVPPEWRAAGEYLPGGPAAGPAAPAGPAGSAPGAIVAGPAGLAPGASASHVSRAAASPPRPGNAMARRAPMRSPYRWVPVLVALLVIGAAVYQATRPPARASAADIAAARALNGRCLARSGGTEASPAYSATSVACGSAVAAVRVVAVLVPGTSAGASGTAGSSAGAGPGGAPGTGPEAALSCPKGSVEAQVLEPGVVGEAFECLAPVGAR